MRNLLLEIEYDGTKYAGWQAQKNALSLQEILEKKLSLLLGEKIKLIASGRTDAGVHALAQAANFKTKSSLDEQKILKAINSLLPKDIAVKNIKKIPLTFNARFKAKSKVYRYLVYNCPQRSAFGYKYHWHLSYKLDISLMRREFKKIVGEHNFKSFAASDKRERQMRRKIIGVSLRKKNNFLIIDIEGKSFLYNMVRNIVGTLVEIGRGKLPRGSMSKILKAKDRKKAGPCAPPKGLYLVKVKF